jgi:hypothetical protein
MALSAAEKEDKLKNLFKRKDEIQAEINALLSPDKVTLLPDDFSVQAEVFKIVQENQNGIHAKTILTQLQNKFPSFKLNRKQVSGALVYLKSNRKKIENIGRGLYRPVASPIIEVMSNLVKDEE